MSFRKAKTTYQEQFLLQMYGICVAKGGGLCARTRPRIQKITSPDTPSIASYWYQYGFYTFLCTYCLQHALYLCYVYRSYKDTKHLYKASLRSRVYAFSVSDSIFLQLYTVALLDSFETPLVVETPKYRSQHGTNRWKILKSVQIRFRYVLP